MRKEKKLLFNYLSWFFVLFSIIFIGVNNVFGATTLTIYPNSNFSQNSNNYSWLNSNGSISTASVGNTISGVAYGFGFSFQENISINKTYTLVINFKDYDLLSSFQSSYVHISNCTSSSCNDSAIISVTKNVQNNNSNKLTIVFNATSIGSYFNVGLSSSGPPYNALTGEVNFGISSVTLDSTNSTQDIIDNQTNNTNNIITNNNSNTHNIISSASENTDRIIDNFNDCRDSYNLFNKNDLINGYIQGNGVLNVDSTARTTNYFIPVEYGQKYSLSGTNNRGIISLYDSNKNFISNNIVFQQDGTFIINAYYVKISVNYTLINSVQFQKGSTTSYEDYGTQICKNKIDETNDRIGQTNQELGDLNNNLTDETGPNTSGLSNVAGWLPPGPVDSILTLPLTFLNSLNNAIGGTCSAVNVNLPFVNKTLNIPCFTTFMSQYLPNFNTLYTWIGGIVSVYILFNYLLSLYKWVDDTLSLRENTMPGYFDDKFGGGA